MKSGTQGCALETCIEVVPLSQAIRQGPGTHAPAPEALQNAAAVSQISIKEAKGTFTRISKVGESNVYPDLNQDGERTFARISNQDSGGNIFGFPPEPIFGVRGKSMCLGIDVLKSKEEVFS